ncbi:MAG: zinc transporter ZupT [Actinomycetota bacterium]|nr:zinc transporter ZupT [Actinomycetota bacterium]MDA2981041.1 zinc transporter ZupT [Actinomycetota bacterium]
METAVLFAFLVTLGAGLATAVGAAIGLFAKHTNRQFLAVALGFSAGVMIYVSFVEILAKAQDYISQDSGEFAGALTTAGAFLAGLAGMALMYRLIPELEHPKLNNPSTKLPGEEPPVLVADKLLFRAGLGVALAVTLHNFPEGMVTFFLTLDDPQVGVSVAVAIAIHNIPEGIAVVVPIYYATRNRKLAFGFGALSGLAELLGAIIGYAILQPFITDQVLGIVFAVVAGIMVYISIDSLLPAARQYGSAHLAIYGMIAGMGVMAASLVLFML